MDGLYSKYTVVRNDTGEEVDNVFCLSPTKDKNARKAIRYYASLIKGTQLSDDLYSWLSEFEEKACVYYRICPLIETPCCCGECRYRDECFEECKCDLIEQGVYDSKKECEEGV